MPSAVEISAVWIGGLSPGQSTRDIPVGEHRISDVIPVFWITCLQACIWRVRHGLVVRNTVPVERDRCGGYTGFGLDLQLGDFQLNRNPTNKRPVDFLGSSNNFAFVLPRAGRELA